MQYFGVQDQAKINISRSMILQEEYLIPTEKTTREEDLKFVEEVLGILRKKIKGQVFDGEERSQLLAIVGLMSRENEDFDHLLEEATRTEDQNKMYDLVQFLAEAGKIEYARQIAGKIKNPDTIFRAYLYIASRSKDGQDFRSAITAMDTHYKADDIDKRSMTSELIESLAKAKKYQWAYQMTRGTRHRDVEIGRIANMAFEAEDYTEAFRFAIQAQEAKIAFNVVNVFIKKEDMKEARRFADMIAGICNANYYRAYAYLKIALRTDDPEDFKKAFRAAKLSRKNDSKSFSSDILMYIAILYRNKYLAGIACDEALKNHFRESTVKQLLVNLQSFKAVTENKTEPK